MRARPDRPERLFHFQQSHSNSCQPACIAMAGARHGANAVAMEAVLHVGAGPHGHFINAHLNQISGASLVSGDVENRQVLDQYRAELASGAWLMLAVFGPRRVARLPAGCVSPLGRLAAPNDLPMPLHSIVLVGFEAWCFYALDPWHDSTQQPFELSDDALMSLAAGFKAMRLV